MPSLFLMVAMFNLTLIVAGLKELILDDLGGTTADASLFFSIEMLAYIFFAPLWGVISDRLGVRKPLVVVGFLASGVCYLAYSSVESLGVLLGLRFVQGAFSVMGWSTVMAMIVDFGDEERRGRYMGIMGACLIFGVSIGAPIGGILSRQVGVRAPLDVAGGLFLLLGALSLLLPAGAARSSQVSMADMAAALRRCPRLALPYVFHFADRYTVGFFVVLFPQYLATLGVDDPELRGRYLALFLLPFAFLQYFTGRLTERVGPVRPLLAGSTVYGLTLCWVGVADLYQLWWVMAALGVLAAVMFPPAMALVGQLSTAEVRGSAMGGFNLAGSLGFAVGPLVGNAVFERWGFGAAFVSAGALEVAVVSLAALYLWRWRRPR
ncbi:MAG: MFS transporter [Acidobacteriota bacterium]